MSLSLIIFLPVWWLTICNPLKRQRQKDHPKFKTSWTTEWDPVSRPTSKERIVNWHEALFLPLSTTSLWARHLELLSSWLELARLSALVAPQIQWSLPWLHPSVFLAFVRRIMCCIHKDRLPQVPGHQRTLISPTPAPSYNLGARWTTDWKEQDLQLLWVPHGLSWGFGGK